MRIRKFKNDREELDQEVLVKGRITNMRIYPDFSGMPNIYRVEIVNGGILELTHYDIFGVLEKENEND